MWLNTIKYRIGYNNSPKIKVTGLSFGTSVGNVAHTDDGDFSLDDNKVILDVFTGFLNNVKSEIWSNDRVRISTSTGKKVDGYVSMKDGCWVIIFDHPINDPQGFMRHRDYLKVYVANHVVKVLSFGEKQNQVY